MTIRPHFGVYLSSVEEACQSEIWHGISRFAQDFECSITAYVSTYQQRVGVLKRHYQVTRDLAGRATDLDGMLFLGGPVMDGLGAQKAEEYCNWFSEKPLVNISMEYGKTVLMVNNREGMRKIVDHLISVHGYSRIAFVQGPRGHREADERYEAYREALDAAGISYDPQLVCEGTFTYKSGIAAVGTLLDARAVSCEAIVAVDDETALGVLHELRRRGIKVPANMAVTGFDDIVMAEANSPSLTTIQQPFFNLGYVGARQLLDRCIGKEDDSITTLTPDLVIRQSCGCVTKDALLTPKADDERLRELKESLIQALTDSVKAISRSLAEQWFTELSLYLLKLPESEERFLQAFDQILADYRCYSSDFSIWKRILMEFQATISKLFEKNQDRLNHLNTVILRSSWLVLDALRSEDKKIEIESNRVQWKIRGIAHTIMTAFDFNDLYNKLELGFRDLGIKSVLVGIYNRPVRYDDGWNTPEELRVIMAFNENRRLIDAGEYQKILIPELLQKEQEILGNRVRTMLVMPLFFGDEQLGVVMLEENRDMPVDMYETVRLALSTAVKGAALFTEIRDLSIKDELTGLYNRRGLLTRAEPHFQADRQRRQHSAVLFIDLDGLKEINDTYGHAEGDTAITETARILTQATRKGDVLSRLGGDEFVLFVPSLGDDNTDQIVERVRKAFNHFNSEVSSKPYELSCSIGAVSSSDEDNSFEILLNRADTLLYSEKRKKKSRE